MPHHCAVSGCTSNSKSSPGLAFHCFPSDADLRKLWLTRIRRDEVAGQFQVTSSTRVCGNHFPPSAYFLAGHAGERKRERKTERKSSRLVKGAAPSEFECFPEHLRPMVPKRKAPVERQPLQPKAKRLDVGRSVAAGADSDGDRADEPCTKHCHCVSSLVDKATELEDALEDERSAHALTSSLLKEATDKKSSPVFCLEKFAGDDKKIRYYTGFFTIGVFMACFHFLEKSAREMRCWAGRRTRSGVRLTEKVSTGRKLSLENQFFLVMVRLRLGLDLQDLADRFGVSSSTASRLFISWINLMHYKFRELPVWLSRRKIRKLMPPCFKKWYPSTRTIIDGTEFFIERPSNLARQSATWSNYKNHNTMKALICISPDGSVTFVSSIFEGAITDAHLVEQCGILAKLEPGDSIMADKGFDIQHLLAPIGVRLNIPPFRRGERVFTPDDVMKTKKIAAVRIHVERAINRIKEFSLVGRVIPNSLWDTAEQIIHVCAYLTNWQPALVG